MPLDFSFNHFSLYWLFPRVLMFIRSQIESDRGDTVLRLLLALGVARMSLAAFYTTIVLPRLPQIFAHSQREKAAVATSAGVPADVSGSTVASSAAASAAASAAVSAVVTAAASAASSIQQRDIARLFDATMARVLRLWAQSWPQEAPDAAQQWAAAECIPNGCALAHSPAF
jgi:hypothetical protein